MILGIDAGGTKTRAVVIDGEGNILHEGIGGAGNYFVVGVEGVQKAIEDAIGEYKNKGFEIAILGLAGGGLEEKTKRYLEDEMKKVIKAKKIEVYNDCYVALIGAIGERKSGMIILSGTGSMIIGIDKKGMHHKTGGWGHLLGDEGSGYRISYDAIRAVMSYWEGMGPYTILEEAVGEKFGFKEWSDVIDFFYSKGAKRDRIASLSPYVIECAERGDFVAMEIVRNNIKSLLTGIGKVKLDIDDDYISYGGGMFNSVYYKNIVKEELNIMGFKLYDPIFSPVGGALFMGLLHLGIKDQEVLEKIRKVK